MNTISKNKKNYNNNKKLRGKKSDTSKLANWMQIEMGKTLKTMQIHPNCF
jgi:hypothetical protein